MNSQLTTESKTDSSSDSQSLRKLCKVPQNLLNRLAIQHGSLILLTPRCMGISVYIYMDGHAVVVGLRVSCKLRRRPGLRPAAAQPRRQPGSEISGPGGILMVASCLLQKRRSMVLSSTDRLDSQLSSAACGWFLKMNSHDEFLFRIFTACCSCPKAPCADQFSILRCRNKPRCYVRKSRG